MQSVTPEWLHERGALHDARVLEVRAAGPVIEISLDDEWASMRGLTRPEGQEAPGTLVIESFSAKQGEPSVATGGWISEVTLVSGELDFVFCDRPQLTLDVASAWWRSAT